MIIEAVAASEAVMARWRQKSRAPPRRKMTLALGTMKDRAIILRTHKDLATIEQSRNTYTGITQQDKGLLHANGPEKMECSTHFNVRQSCKALTQKPPAPPCPAQVASLFTKGLSNN